jgi:hypothetical protein
MDLKIDRLLLNIENGSGHEHRVGPITERAVALFAERAAKSLEGKTPRSGAFDSLSGPPVDLNLNSTSNEQAAHAIAEAWLQVLMLRLGR